MNDDKCKNLRDFYKGDCIFKLMLQNGVCSYAYMISWEKFEKTKLPAKSTTYSKLNIKVISDQGYEHAQHVLNRITPEFENVTLGNYNGNYFYLGSRSFTVGRCI